jgi:transmembrane sensor
MTEQYIEELIQKYADGSASDEEIKILTDWYRKAPPAEVVWPSSDADEKEKVYNRMLGRLQSRIAPKRSRIYELPLLKAAAIFVVIIGVALLVYFLKPFSTSYITVTNPSGKIQFVRLPDSSSVWLNASTTLRYTKKFTSNRSIQLDGEAYFDVTHDPEHPFTIATGDVQTTVLGTSFNIKAYQSNTTTVSLITGKLRVESGSKELAILTPLEQLQFDRSNKIATASSLDTNTVLAWKKGILSFQGQTLADITEVLERWYSVKISFSTPGTEKCRYYMSFDNKMPLNELLGTMSEITEMKYTINKQTITISGKPCL